MNPNIADRPYWASDLPGLDLLSKHTFHLQKWPFQYIVIFVLCVIPVCSKC